jgi:transcription elongation factor GreA
LPPGALNYMTRRGARRLESEAAQLRQAGEVSASLERERLLSSATIVDPPDAAPDAVIFGATVTVQAADGTFGTYRIVGVDEVDFGPNSVSWVSPQGRALLGAERGQKLVVEPGGPPVVVIESQHE